MEKEFITYEKIMDDIGITQDRTYTISDSYINECRTGDRFEDIANHEIATLIKSNDYVREDFASYKDWNQDSHVNAYGENSIDDIDFTQIKEAQSCAKHYLHSRIDFDGDFNQVKTPEQAKTAISDSDPNVWFALPENLQQNKEVILEALRTGERVGDNQITSLSHNLKEEHLSDYGFMEQCHKANSNFIDELPRESKLAKEIGNKNPDKFFESHKLAEELQNKLSNKSQKQDNKIKL